jgi:putative sigma-54 modulation protein
MKFEIYGKNIEVTEGMRNKIEKKLSALEKYFLIDELTVARVVVRVYPTKQKIEVTIPTKMIQLRAEVVHDDLYAAIDLVIDKLEDQIRKQKSRLTRGKHKEGLSEAFIAMEMDETNDILVRTKQVDAEFMDVEEAIMRMEMLNHSFFLYTDSETEKVAVVYKRVSGGYGLLETQ